MRPSKTKPSTGTNQFEGFEQQTQQRGEAESALLGSDRATLVRIEELKAALTTAAAMRQADVKAYAALWKQWRQAVDSLSKPAAEYVDRVEIARKSRALRIENARQAFAHAEWLAKRAGTGPADGAWQTYLEQSRQAKDDYAAAVAKAKADYRAAIQRLELGRLQPHLAESFDSLDDEAQRGVA